MLYLFSTVGIGRRAFLLCTENKGFAVDALVDGGVLFVSADHNAFKSAVVAAFRMICTLGYGAGDRMIGFLDLFHFRYHP